MQQYETHEEAKNRQLDFEDEMVSDGIKKYKAIVNLAREQGNETNTYGSYTAFVQCIDKMADYIKKECDYAVGPNPGRKKAVFKELAKDDPTTLACIVSRAILNSMSTKRKITELSNAIIDGIHYQRKQDEFKRNNPSRYKRAKKTMDNQSNDSWKRFGLTQSAKAAGVDFQTEKLNQQVGLSLIEIFITVTGFASYLDLRNGQGKVTRFVEPTKEFLDKIAERNDLFGSSMPNKLPMLIKPTPWESLTNGGYLNNRLSGPMIRGTSEKYRKELESHSIDEVYSAINTIQDTGFRINNQVMLVADYLFWEPGVKTRAIGQLVKTRLPEDLPVRPVPNEEFDQWKLDNPKEFKKYNDSRKAKHKEHTRKKSKSFATRDILEIAEKLQHEDSFYYGVSLDFRGRSYPIAKLLNVQGNGLSRGLLEYAEPQPYGKNGAFWVKVACANAYGYDKCSFDDRAKWVDDNHQAIIDCANSLQFTIDENDEVIVPSFDSKDRAMFEEADSPFEFLAACFELKGFWEAPMFDRENYMSRFCVGLDASQSGIQNLSALTRDYDGAAKVNLIPGDHPEDLYAEVAGKVNIAIDEDLNTVGLHKRNIKVEYHEETGKWKAWAKINKVSYQMSQSDTEEEARDKATNFDLKDIARAWVGKVNRKICKKSTMTKCYSATLFAQNDFLKEYLTDERDSSPDGATDSLGKDIKDETRWHCILYLARKIWDSINLVAGKANEVMEWCETVAKLVANQGLYIWWTTPTGLLVQQSTAKYKKTQDMKIDLHLNFVKVRKRIQAKRKFEINEVNPRQSSQSFSPNFVHSLDSSVLMKTVNLAKERGITNFTFVHDSFGTSPGSVDTLNECIRESFVEMYKEDLLGKLYEELKQQSGLDLPKPPTVGTLDLDLVKQSKYFFA